MRSGGLIRDGGRSTARRACTTTPERISPAKNTFLLGGLASWEDHPLYVAARYTPQGTEEWKENRRTLFLLTASEAANVLWPGCSPSRYALWAIKTGRTGEPSIPPHVQELFDAGHRDEPTLVEQFRAQFYPGEVHETGTYAVPGMEYVGASADRLLEDGRIAEVKSRQEDRSARLPTIEQWCQVQVQLRAYQTDACAYICGNVKHDQKELVIAWVRRSEEAWQDWMEPGLREFCHSVVHEQPPSRVYKMSPDLRRRCAQWYEQTVYQVKPVQASARAPFLYSSSE
jgi:hypothetical protein